MERAAHLTSWWFGFPWCFDNAKRFTLQCNYVTSIQINVSAPDEQLFTELKHFPEAFTAAENLPETSFLPDLYEKLEPRSLLFLKLIIGKVDDPLDIFIEASPNGLVDAELLKPSSHLSS